MLGRLRWAISAGRIPLRSSGHEPECTSFDKICILNAEDRVAKVKITFFYCDRNPIGPYPIEVGARRVKHFRVNDLINPEAVPLDTDYGAIIESDVPIVVQFLRQDTSGKGGVITSLPPLPLE